MHHAGRLTCAAAVGLLCGCSLRSLSSDSLAAELRLQAAPQHPWIAALRTRRDQRHCSRVSDTPSIKPDARHLVESLPEAATWDDLAHEVFVRQSVEAGLREADAGRLLSHEDALARIRRIRRVS